MLYAGDCKRERTGNNLRNLYVDDINKVDNYIDTGLEGCIVERIF